MAAIALRHITFITSGKVFVVDGGPKQVVDGVVTVDASEPLNALSLWHNGYRINDETGEEIRNPGDLDDLIASLTGEAHEEQVSDDEDIDEDETEKVDEFVEALMADAEAPEED